MRVLAWQQYGNMRVYAAETPMHFMKIHEALKEAMSGWGEDEGLAELFELMGKARTQKICERHFLGFIHNHLRTHKTLSAFEFCDLENA